jgi:hypothetical protein
MRTRASRLADETGMSMVLVSAGFMAFCAATTLAIDVGMFMAARAQAQNSADAAALAGATALVYNDWNDRSSTGPAVLSAINTGIANKVMHGDPSIQSGDVTFPLDAFGRPNLVKVTVFRTSNRNNPVPTLIGPIFGMVNIDIQATATAQAAPAIGMTCVKPFIIPDKWTENQDPAWSQTSTFDRYDNKGVLLPNPDAYTTRGYGEADRGMRLVLRSAHGNNINPSMYYSWKMPDDVGGEFYRENIANCNTSVIGLGYIANQEPGAKEGPTLQGLQDLLDKDPNAYWDDSKKDYVSDKRPSPRVFPLPLYNPDEYQGGKETGRVATLIVSNWLGFFLEDINGSEVYGRIFPITGIAADESGATTDTLAYVIRLVQ